MAIAGKDSKLPKAESPSDQPIFHDPYVTAYKDDAIKVVRYVRSPAPFPDLETTRRTYESLIAVLAGLRCPHYGILADLRAVQGRNDPAFEGLIIEVRTRLHHLFARRGTLVATAVGAMQLRRLNKEEGIERMISADESELLRYLTPEPAPPSCAAQPAAPEAAKAALKPKNKPF